MDYFVEELLESNLNKYLLEGRNDGNHNFILFSEEYITVDNRKISENKIEIVVGDKNLMNRIFAKHGFVFEERRRFEWRAIVPVDFYPRSIRSDDFTKFAFNGIMIECQKTEDGKPIIPNLLKFQFKDCFPKIEFETEDGELRYEEYTGSYPAECNGLTMLRYGGTKIYTHLLHKGSFRWSINRPPAFKHTNLPEDLLAKDGKKSRCCGACEW